MRSDDGTRPSDLLRVVQKFRMSIGSLSVYNRRVRYEKESTKIEADAGEISIQEHR